MKTINGNIENEIIIKNSRFICLLIKLNDEKVKQILDEIKDKYPKATHYCYGYKYNDKMYASDDGEPGGTAGMPILNVIEKEDLTNILVVVVRYFGGIKLGAGGLIRAYTKAVTETLGKTIYRELVEGKKIKITFPYSLEKQMNYLLKNAFIHDKLYDLNITYIVSLTNKDLEQLNNYDYTILEDIYLEKE